MHPHWASLLALIVAAACSNPLSELDHLDVRGTVRSTLSGNAVGNARISVIVDRGLFGQTALGATGTDAAGGFQIRVAVPTGDCAFLRLRIEGTGYSAAPSVVAVLGQSIACGSHTLALLMYPAVVSVAIEPATLTVAAGGTGVLRARGVFEDGFTGPVPANGDSQGTLWSVLGTSPGATCGHLTPDQGANPVSYQAPASVPVTDCGTGQGGSVLIALFVEYGGRVVWDSVRVTIAP